MSNEKFIPTQEQCMEMVSTLELSMSNKLGRDYKFNNADASNIIAAIKLHPTHSWYVSSSAVEHMGLDGSVGKVILNK
jgi:hypothetical protein